MGNKFTIKITTDLNTYDLKPALEKSLRQATQIVRGQAIEYAPYMTGTLRRSISVDNRLIRDLKGVVFTDIPYARIREFVNKKNPRKKFYFKRALKVKERKITEIFNKNIDNV